MTVFLSPPQNAFSYVYAIVFVLQVILSNGLTIECVAEEIGQLSFSHQFLVYDYLLVNT